MSARVAKILSCFLFIFVCFCDITAGQTASKRNFDSPPDSLFTEAQYAAHPDIPFIYSFKKLNVSFEQIDGSVVAVMDYHVRVKVFDASVPQASVVSIPYYEQNGLEKISAIHAVTWNSPTDSTVLKSNEIRTIDLNARYNLKEFTMPNVQDGAVLEYSYQIRRRYIEELPAFYLANQMPTKLAKVVIKYPHYLRYDAIIQDYGYGVKHKKIMIPIEEAPEIFTNPQPDPIVKEIWTARNIPAVQKQRFIPTLSDYRGKIKFQLSAFGIPRQPLENSWQYVVEEIRQKQQLFETIKSNKKAYKIGSSIRNAVSSPKAAQDSIYRYLVEQAHHNGKTMPFSSVPDTMVLAGKETNQAAINQTLIAMLHGADIKAYPVLISTRKSGQINKSYPSFFQFNGQLVQSKVDDKTYLMDASFSYSQPGLIPVQAYNQTGLLVKKNKFKWINIDPSKSAFSIQVDMEAELETNGTLEGHIVTTYQGYPARKIRLKKSKGIPAVAIVEQLLFGNYLNVQLSEVRIKYLNSYDQPIKIKANFVLPNYATVYKRGIRFRPMVVGSLMQNPFDRKQRSLPVTLDAPEKLQLNYSITFPEHYNLSTQLDDQQIKMPGATFTEDYAVDGNTVNYRVHINISRKQFGKKLYPQLLNFYEHWVQLSNARWFID